VQLNFLDRYRVDTLPLFINFLYVAHFFLHWFLLFNILDYQRCSGYYLFTFILYMLLSRIKMLHLFVIVFWGIFFLIYFFFVFLWSVVAWYKYIYILCLDYLFIYIYIYIFFFENRKQKTKRQIPSVSFKLGWRLYLLYWHMFKIHVRKFY
jgi:hypothetical protein